MSESSKRKWREIRQSFPPDMAALVFICVVLGVVAILVGMGR